MTHAVRPFLHLLALVWLALGMSVPVSAWSAHQSAHAFAEVALGVAHHHDLGGDVVVHDHGENDSRDTGPDHMPSVMCGVAAIPDSYGALSAPVTERMVFAIPQSRGVERHASDELRRPPRLG